MPYTLNSEILFIVIALLVAALLGFLIGWLMKTAKLDALKKSLDACYKNKELLERELKLQKEQIAFDQDIKKTKNTSAVSEIKPEKKELKVASTYASTPNASSSSYDASKAKAVMGKAVKENDLKVVEGIGPKIEEILNKDGISTWKQLGNAPVSRIQNILNEAGDRFLFHKPDTWPKQSMLAAEAKWEELKKLQDYLDGDKEPV
ncbi:MAG: hypothetical protein ABF242_00385 [Flavobacteriales bacterium]